MDSPDSIVDDGWVSGARDRSCAPIGIVLAGGQARRLGGGKATARLGGRPLASYPVEAMRAAGLEPLMVAKPDSELPDLDCHVLYEPAQPRHPLCGILAALRDCDGRPLVLCACDMPFPEPALLAWLGQLEVPLAVVEEGDRLHPLLGRYEPVLLEALAEQLRLEAPLTESVVKLGAQVIGGQELARFGDPERMCLNVNTPADLVRAEQLLESRDQDGPHPPPSPDLAR
jgi:molybdenum cofactor guanylyltransferase